MREIVYEKQFKKDFKKFQRIGRNMARFKEAVEHLQAGKALPEIYRDHDLTGNLKDFRECHLGGDFLLMYYYTETELILVRMGTHSQLFG